MSREISSPLLRTRRLLDLVPYINTHQGIELKELARHFDVTASQMHADLMTLWMCGLPGYTPLELMNLDFESGYVSISNAPTLSKPRTITFQEGVALLLGLDLIESALTSDRQDLLDSIDSLRKRLREKLGVPVRLSVVSSTSADVSVAITKALVSNGGLNIKYHSLYKDQTSERSVMPIDLYESDGHQYIHAFCFTAQDYREFRIDRIEMAEQAVVSTDFEINQPSFEKIQFSITAKVLSRDSIERFAIPNLESGKTAELSSFSRQWIERSIMAGGGTVTLNSPSDIRASVAEMARLMLNRYKQA
jgi:proteasome accessory factor C